MVQHLSVYVLGVCRKSTACTISPSQLARRDPVAKSFYRDYVDVDGDEDDGDPFMEQIFHYRLHRQGIRVVDFLLKNLFL